jgi:hypothetical protein
LAQAVSSKAQIRFAQNLCCISAPDRENYITLSGFYNFTIFVFL